jgi:lipopolysaccharide transport system permease protein
MIETDSASIAPPMERPSALLPAEPGPLKLKAADGPDAVEETIIRPLSGWIGINWREMWTHRELLLFLIKRDILVRYKQTVLGIAWAVVQPLLTMAIFTLIFGRFAGIPPEGFPYPVFVFAGLIPWTLFSQGMAASAMSLVNQQHLLTKVYFPRLFIPVAAAAVFLVDLAISLAIYGLLLSYYIIFDSAQLPLNWMPSLGTVWLLALVPLTLIATLGIGLTLASLSVFYRDFKHIVPFLVQILMYVSPVIYPARLVGHWWPILSFNPMFGIIDAYRSAILGLPWNFAALAISSATAIVLFLFSIFYFRKTERRFADFA